jgi:hypothetical protein
MNTSLVRRVIFLTIILQTKLFLLYPYLKPLVCFLPWLLPFSFQHLCFGQATILLPFLIFPIFFYVAHIRTLSYRTCGDFLSARAIVHTPIALEMEQEGEASSSKIHLLYRDVRKFQHNGSNVGNITKMLWKMLQEVRYDKQTKYYRTQVTYEDSEPM